MHAVRALTALMAASALLACPGPTPGSDGGNGPGLAIADAEGVEGDAGASLLAFQVTLSEPASQDVTVEFQTVDGSALEGEDYDAAAGSLTFAPGETTKTVLVAINGDGESEPDETFSVALGNASGAELTDALATGFIENDDGDVSLSIGNATVSEADASATFTVTLSAASGSEVTVAFATSPGTASSSDFSAATGTLTFAPGDLAKEIAVPITSDALDEADETFTVTLSSPVNAALSTASGTGTITDDDELPALSISDRRVQEGNSGTSTATFRVTLSAASGRTVSATFATANGSAQAGSDYTSTSGTISFAAGELEKDISVTIVGDGDVEPDEDFTVTLTSPQSATLDRAEAVGTIGNDDAVGPGLSIADATIAETNSGSTALTFDVTLSPAAAQTVTVTWSTSSGSATSGVDFNAASGTLTFTAGQVSKTVTVNVLGDVHDEPNESFVVDLLNVTNAALVDSQAVGTITDNDAEPTLSITNVTLNEGAAGTREASFSLALSAPSGRTVSVAYATSDDSAVAPGDYVATSGQVTFLPGRVSQVINVPVRGDTLNEATETFKVTLSSPVNATLADAEGVGTITNDDPRPDLTISNASVAEGDAGQKQLNFTVSLSAASGRPVTVDYQTNDDTATAGSDYTSASGTLTFAPGTRSMSISVAVLGDERNEQDESFTVNLSNAPLAVIADGVGRGTIIDDDSPLPRLTVNDASVTEGNSGQKTIRFTVTLSVASTDPVTVSYATEDLAAVAGSDYEATSGTLTFAPGTTSRPIDVQINGDVLDEGNERFKVLLTGPSRAIVLDGEGFGTITDDDTPPALSIDDVTVTEGDAGATQQATFTVSLSAPSGRAVTVNYATVNATATAAAGFGGNDFEAASEVITLPAGTTSQTFSVPVNGDDLNEANEFFNVDLSGAVNATLADARGRGTITDNDAAPAISITDVQATEGNSGTKSFGFVLTLSAASAVPATVSFATANGTATAPGDYTARTGSITFPAGDELVVVNVQVVGNNAAEPDETFVLNLSSPQGATLADSQGEATILNDD